MSRFGLHSAFAWSLVAFFQIQQTIYLEASPLVLSIFPNAARPGDRLEVKGTGLKGTREVLFVSGAAAKLAKFNTMSDELLEVTFPEFYRGTGSATLIIVSKQGVTVAMSSKMETIDANSGSTPSAPFLNIKKGGTVNYTTGIAVIEEGGLVARSYLSGVSFVKSKGMLAEFKGAVIFEEPGAILGVEIKTMRMPPRVISVHEITISPNIEPVLIKSPEAPQPFAKDPPSLMAITPSVAMIGDIVVFSGRNLAQVSNVYFFDSGTGLLEAGFKAMNNQTLRVEVPPKAYGRQLIVLKNPAGISVNITENPPPSNQYSGRLTTPPVWMNGTSLVVEYVRPGYIENAGGGSRIFVIDNLGTLTTAGGGCCILARNGGRLASRLGGGCAIFHEAHAIVPSATGAQNQPSGMQIMDIGTMTFSHLPLNLDIVQRY